MQLPHNPATNRRFSTDTTVLLAADRVGNAVSDDLDLPDEFKCPITCEVMQDPVIALDGHTYERASVEKWMNVVPPGDNIKVRVTSGDYEGKVGRILCTSEYGKFAVLFENGQQYSVSKNYVDTEKNLFSPTTGEPLASLMLIPNNALRSQVN